MAFPPKTIVEFPARPGVDAASFGSVDGPAPGTTAGTHTVYGSRNGPRTQIVLLVNGVDAGTVTYGTAWTWQVTGVELEAPSTELTVLAYYETDGEKEAIMRRYGLGLVPPGVFSTSLAVAAAITIDAPAAETELVSGYETEFSGTVSPSDDGVALYRDAECTDKIADATVPGDGTWSYDWTPEITDAGLTAVYAKNDSGQSTSVVVTVRESTPNDLMISETRAVAAWYVSVPEDGIPGFDYGEVSLDEASVPSDQSTWDSNLEVTVGGSNAVKATTANSRHYCYESSPTASIGSYCDIDVSDCVAQGSQVWVRVWAGTDYCNVNLSTGAEGNKSGANVSCTAGVVAFRSVAARDCRVELLEPAQGDDASAIPAVYVGSTSDGYTGDVTFTQPRAALVADCSLLNNGTPRGADVAQTTDASQPLFYAPFASVNGLPVAYHESGRTAYMSTSHADPVAAMNGAPPTYAFIAVGSMSANLSRLISATGGGDNESPLLVSGAGLGAYRLGTSASSKSYGVSASLLSSATSIVVIANSDRTLELWIDGTYQATLTHDNAGTVACTGANLLYSSSSTSEVIAELALFAGQIPGADAAARYAVLRDQAGLAAMAARWGVSA